MYYCAGLDGLWERIPGQLCQVSVSANGEHVWGVGSWGGFYYRNGSLQPALGNKRRTGQHYDIVYDGASIFVCFVVCWVVVRLFVYFSWFVCGFPCVWARVCWLLVAVCV